MSEQRVLLINPPQRTDLRRILGLKAPPMGLLYIAAYLEKAGIPVEVLDADLLDLSASQIAKQASFKNPYIIGITAITSTIKSAFRVARHVRRVLPNIVIIVGGAHPTFMPEQTLFDCPEIDLVVRGEGEETMLEIAQTLRDFQWGDYSDVNQRFSGMKGFEFNEKMSPIKGIAYRNPQNPREVILTPNRPLIEELDSIPFPARHLVPFERYKVLGKETALGTIITSRGCPFKCAFCSSSRIVGKKYRARSPENILQEVELLHYRYRLKHIELLDDIFTLNQDRAIKFSEMLRSQKMDVQWVASSRVDTISKETMKAMKKAGLMMLYFGAESGSPRVLKLMNKGITIEKTEAAFKQAKNLGISLTGSFILGYPGETLGEMQQTINFALKLDPEFAQFCILTPYPGTPIYDELLKKDLLLTNDWDKYNTLEPVVKYEALGYTYQNVQSMLKKAYFSFYIRPKFLIKHRRLIPAILKSNIIPQGLKITL
ncbi:MAG: radical SAM protein [Candidatus Bathyarchaeia archaeon]